MMVSMKHSKRPERLLGAAVLVAVLALDAIVFNEVKLSVLLLGGVLVVVLVVGAFDPVAESVSFQVSILIVCVLLTGYALFRGLLAVGGIAALAAVNAGWIAYSDHWAAGRHESR
ncbi:hypothetical protein [Salinarchaeum chitinilyticum]